jgi:cell division ATPase FtsA
VGSRAAVEVVATFLPRVVVDSLFSSLKRADLEIYSMTLEPIAALSIAIPPNMRLLNLALVDIGAGTSDIAIVKNGNIFAYAMVPFGGDELTEHLASTFLLDFNSAEELKCRLSTQERLQFADILDNQIEMPAEEIIGVLEPMVQELASQIIQNILLLNQKNPDAILLVGGGSLTPGLNSQMANMLQIPRNRIGIRTRDSFKQISGDFEHLNGPQGVTPLGIAYYSLDKPPVPFIKVVVNGREVALWNLGDIDVASALLSSGISLNNVYGKPGMGKTIEINGYLKVFKGEMGTAPLIKVNGAEATLETPVKDGDEIEFAKGQDGQDAVVNLESINPGAPGYVYINGERLELTPVVTVNGQEYNPAEPIPDRAKVEIERLNRLDQILLKAGLAESLTQERSYEYYLNDQPMFLKWTPLTVMVDGEKAQLTQTANFGSYIEYRVGQERPRLKDVINLAVDKADCVVTVNGEKVVLPDRGYC